MALSTQALATASRLLDEALALGPAQRAAWLQALPAEHAELVPALREVLARAASASAMLLDRPPRLPPRRAAERSEPSALNAGERIGPYELVRRLGAGGMAEVWLARRADGAYRRDVALKLPKFTRLRKDLERLFSRERDILASLEQPHIARLYDAGVSPAGLPYLAMEYVQGEPLTLWCDARRVGLRERLNLFLQVTGAVHYAHERKVIHRDLKPSNILVTDAGQVRLLDFGIAKLLAEEEADLTPVHFYARALTPDYASPELLRGEIVESTSDVYSLGAVLYELLTGNRPYRLEPARSAAQFARAVANTRVARPSRGLAAGAGIARATTQERLAGRLQGSLDALVLKALAWCPADRYASVAAFANDLQRYLDGQPVRAIPDRLTAAELVAALSRNPNVRIRSRLEQPRAPRRNAGADVNADERDAAMLPAHGVDASRMSLHVTVQLVRKADASQLWSETYEHDLGAGVKTRHDLARTVATAVKSALESGAPKTKRKDPKS